MGFALLSYETANLGDYIQSLAALQFLPRVDLHVNRESLHEVVPAPGQRLKLICNGWFCHSPDNWPPAACIDPLLISMHITNNPEPGSGIKAREVFAQSRQTLQYLRDHGPVGARDLETLEWLQTNNVPAFYAGCLTLAFERPLVSTEPFVIANDLPTAVIDRISETTRREIRQTSHIDRLASSVADRFAKARSLLDLYARATCVVTSRLHGALPCLAMGVPVLLIDASWDQSRFSGLNELVHHCSPHDFVSGTYSYDIDSPPANPDRHQALRAALIERVSKFVNAADV